MAVVDVAAVLSGMTEGEVVIVGAGVVLTGGHAIQNQYCRSPVTHVAGTPVCEVAFAPVSEPRKHVLSAAHQPHFGSEMHALHV